MSNRYSRVLVAAATSLLLSAPLARAAALDTPTLEGVVVGRTTISVVVTAGASGAPNGFTVEWIPASTFDALGGWPRR